ncbi:nuclear transport factor 2 family protein [Pseudomonas sp. PDNC002]|uniref:nuclear transport factor 2 family protein n=1 Tax=Pseudomonas sp. PDNC002 TaxID=2811422 RepID=UPI001965EE2D|nr:nuclear transport factor 2 family protein [Pseudomonas sp. PDNC002]QRY77751.1 nuclear transport factor 2 family protein [Pseudomonas sp. PDNC002]
MSSAADLLHLHFETFVDKHETWKTLITDDLLWELPYAPSLGHPERLVGREQVLHHVGWFIQAVEDFRFHDVRIHAFADSSMAVAEVKAEGLIRTTGRIYRQEYVLFCRIENGKIAFLREYFDPVRAAHSLDEPIAPAPQQAE